MACRKITFSLPEKLVEDLDYISKRIKVTRSALLSQLVEEPVGTLRELVASVPENPTEEDIIRAKGRSLSVIEERVNTVKGLDNDLFGDYGPRT